MSSLHIIRRPADRLAIDAVTVEKRKGRVAVLFIQDAVGAGASDQDAVYVCEPDLLARGLETSHKRVDYDGICRMLTEYDRVVVW